MIRLRRVLPALLILTAAAATADEACAQRKGGRANPVLTGDFLPVTDAERSLDSVPFAPGAPAVVLLTGQQTTWAPEFATRRYARRIKILTEAGVHGHADHQHSWWGEIRLAKLEARTILPDGTIIEAGDGIDVVQEKDPDGLAITIAFPRVEVGAILDLIYEVRADGLSVREYVVQEDLPVLESRFLIAPPPGQRYRSALALMSDDEVEKSEYPHGGSRMHAWVFRDVPPLPSVPNRPPASDISSKLILINEGFYLFGRQLPYAADWRSLISNHRGFYEDWMKGKDKKTKALAQGLAPATASPRDKAEAVRQALRERFAVFGVNDFPSAESPDEVLDRGRGRSADASLLAIVMLRELGVQAYPAAMRLRSSGSIPRDIPMPSLLDELLVVVPGGGPGGSDLTFSPALNQPVDAPSSDRVGVLAVPYVKGANAPIMIPDVPAADNSITRSLVLKPSLDGSLEGTVTVRVTGHQAEVWRRALRSRDEASRREWIEGRLDSHLPSLHVDLFELQGLDRGGEELLVDVKFSADGALTRAGGRILLNPFLFDRLSASDWAAETRELDIYLGRPQESKDSVLVQLPDGVAEVRLPQPLELDAGAVGSYVSEYGGDGKMLRCSRRHALNRTLFPASAYQPLKAWYTDKARGDEQSIVLELAR